MYFLRVKSSQREQFADYDPLIFQQLIWRLEQKRKDVKATPRPSLREKVDSILPQLKIRDQLFTILGLRAHLGFNELLALTFGDARDDCLDRFPYRRQWNAFEYIPVSHSELVAALRQEYETRGIEVTDQTPLFLSDEDGHHVMSWEETWEIVLKLLHHRPEGCPLEKHAMMGLLRDAFTVLVPW